jgi:HAE1 family hydrophobic/amphiphilic exporter-1
MRANRLLQDVNTDLLLKNPQINVDIQRDKAAALGVTAQQVEDTLYTAYGTRQVSTIFAPQNSYMVIMEAKPEFQTDIMDLSLIYVRSANGQLVPLDSLVRMTPGIGPLTVNHSGQLPSVTLSFNLKPGVALGQATAEVERLAKATLPATISYAFQGTAQAFQSSMQGLGLLLVLAVLVIYMVLAILYESFIHPFTILSALPLAGAGALATLALFRTDLNIYAFVGIIMLVGLVKKNGIIMIDFAIEAKDGKTRWKRSTRRAPRFRPIMMTTMLRLALADRAGWGASRGRRPLPAASVVGRPQPLTLLTPGSTRIRRSSRASLVWLGFCRTSAIRGVGRFDPDDSRTTRPVSRIRTAHAVPVRATSTGVRDAQRLGMRMARREHHGTRPRA